MTASVCVVIGPKTRLGRELTSAALARGDRVVAIARDRADADALAGSGADVVVGPDAADLGGSPVRILVCALGPVHPTDADTPVDPGADAAAVERDLSVIESLIKAAPSATVVLVSTVIAIAPGADRRYYGGWKAVVEQTLRERAERLGADVSVLYPGRLVTAATRPWHRLYTRYSRLATLVEKAATGSPRSRVVGVDARVWMLLRGLSVVVGSLSGSAGTPSRPTPRPSVPRTTEEINQ